MVNFSCFAELLHWPPSLLELCTATSTFWAEYYGTRYIGSIKSVAAALMSRTAWIARIAASPRLTTAMRENIDGASRTAELTRGRTSRGGRHGRDCHEPRVTRE